MRRTLAIVAGSALLFSTSTACFADFQYSENSKMTGGALAGSMKMIGVFSKSAREAGQSASTISLKGNRMRRESSLGTAEIIDLDGKRIIHLNLKDKTYSVMTFEEMRARIEEAKRKAAEQQAKHNKGDDPQLKITPKISVTAGSGTKQILNHTAKEMKTRIDMQMDSTDPNKPASANTWVTADSWIAPVKGYEEVQAFYRRMAKELDWMPGAVFGQNPQFSMASVEIQKSTAELKGMPLLQYTSMGMGQPGATATQTQQQSQSSGNPLTKGIGGIFGKKKDKDKDSQQQTSGAQTTGGSLMDMTIEVTSVSTSPLEASLFEIPAGFKQVQSKGLQ